MKRAGNKSNCPINFTVEIFGDTWSLLIVRDMLAHGKKTYGEFLDSEERIGESVLAEKLLHLETKGIIKKIKDKKDKRKKIYSLTKTGLDVIPIMYEVSKFGSITSSSPKAPDSWFKALEFDKELVIKLWRESIQKGSSFFIGEDSVIKKLGL